MAINSNSYNEDYIRNAKKYFKLAGEIAETFEKSSLSAFSYMGEENDTHCILLPSQLDEARVFEAVISKIDRRKGYVKLPCGLEAFFPANDFNSLADEGKTYLKGKIGFRYSGLGLYQFKRVTENSIEQLVEISDYCDNESGNENTSESQSNKATMTNKTITVVTPQPKVVGKIDLSRFEKKSIKNQTTPDLGSNEDGKKNLHGFINYRRDRISTRTLTYIVDRKNGFAPECNPSQYDYRDNEEVVFDVFETINPKTNLPFGFAVNIRPACEE